MNNSKKKVTFIELLKIIVKRVRISTLILLLITFSSTTFAWFIYATKISASITAHIDSWNILFTNEDNAISEYVNFYIPDLYPGMTTYTDNISATNLGERSATITYEIISVKILGVLYTIDGETLTSAQMSNKLAGDYPFQILMSLSNSLINPNYGSTQFTLTVQWPYESGDDAEDTYWGQQAYQFISNNPGQPCIEMSVKISAIQTQ